MEYGWWSYCSPRTQGALLYKVDPTLGNQSSREDRDSLDGEGGIVFTRISIGCGVVISLRRKYYLHTHRKDKKDDMQWVIPYWLYPNKIKERYKRKTITVILISRLVQWQCSRDRVTTVPARHADFMLKEKASFSLPRSKPVSLYFACELPLAFK